MKIQVKEENVRLDQYLAKELDVSRSQVLKMIKNDEVLVNGKKVKSFHLRLLSELCLSTNTKPSEKEGAVKDRREECILKISRRRKKYCVEGRQKAERQLSA